MDRRQEFLQDIAVLDTEATSKYPPDAEIIEVGILLSGLNLCVNELYCPETDFVPYEVQAITHITTDMVKNMPKFREKSSTINEILKNAKAAVAHNTWYDKKVLEKYGVEHPNWICTMRIAKKLFQHDESVTQYNLPYLRYRLHVDVEEYARKLGSTEEIQHHRALSDVFITYGVLDKLLDEMEKQNFLEDDHPWLDQIIEFSNSPILIERIEFGKHKGKRFDEVPLSYWQWALDNMDSLKESHISYDPDFAHSVIAAVEKHLR